MNEATDRARQAGGGGAATDPGVGSPRKGERYRCVTCGMEVQVTADCHCEDPNMVHFHCCGKELRRA